MKVEKIVILESNKDEQRNIRDICRKLVGNFNEQTLPIENLPIDNEPHCDAIIYGQIDNKRIAILLEITGRNVKQEDYRDKPDNTKRHIKEGNIKSITAIHTNEGLKNHDAKFIPGGILIIDCRKKKRLCAYLSHR
jgi:hypothetical protein